jgi:molecular chaperone DnaK (HSP70)
MTAWALDLGTTNTALSRWDRQAGKPTMVSLPGISRTPTASAGALDLPQVIPSAIQVRTELDVWSRIGQWPIIQSVALLGSLAHIGQDALDRNVGVVRPSFVRSFKSILARQPLRTVARVDQQTYTARDITRLYVRELFASVKRTTGERVREITVTAPVAAFESYRAEVAAALRAAGVRNVKFADEPVAAAAGYGLSLRHERIVLVLDFGGGTLNLALVRMSARGMQQGTCEVLAKAGVPIGGNLVDEWVLTHCCQQLGFDLEHAEQSDDHRFWRQMMLMEASRLKESLFLRDSDTFLLTPPEDMRLFEARLRGEAGSLDLTRSDLTALLQTNGLYSALDQCIADVERQMNARGLADSDIGDVLMVGGSTLLPEIYTRIESRFGRARVRAFQPFEAVAYGACVLASGGMSTSDFIVHDYALQAHDLATGKPRYEVIIPRGTRFPSSTDLWKRQVVPTCALGVPETVFKLVIAELGQNSGGDRRFVWDEQGGLHRLGGAEPSGTVEPVVVPLNAANPSLGTLDPPHQPGDRSARLELAFGVNAERWLVATVRDLKTGSTLLNAHPVVQLL